MGRRRAQTAERNPASLNLVISTAVIVLVILCVFTISTVTFKLARKYFSVEGEQYEYLSYASKDLHLPTSGFRPRRRNPVETEISIVDVSGKEVRMIIPKEISRGGGRKTAYSVANDHDNQHGEYSRERLPPISTSGLLLPGSEEEIFTRKLHALRFRRIIDPHDYPFSLDPGVCQQRDFHPDIIIAVTVPPHLPKVRQYFREHVWGGYGIQYNRHVEKVALLFFSGQPRDPEVEQVMKEESSHNGDIVQASFPDSNFTTTTTTTTTTATTNSIRVISALKWISSRCPKVKFIITATETCFVNIPLMLTELRQRQSLMPLFILGKASMTQYAQQMDRSLKGAQVPHYLERGCLGFPMSVGKLLHEAAVRTPLLQRENIFLTGVCAGLLNIARYDNEAFYFAPNHLMGGNRATAVPREREGRGGEGERVQERDREARRGGRIEKRKWDDRRRG